MKASSPSSLSSLLSSCFFAFYFFSVELFRFLVFTVIVVARAVLKLMLSSWLKVDVALYTGYSSSFFAESFPSLSLIGFFYLEKRRLSFLSALPLSLRSDSDSFLTFSKRLGTTFFSSSSMCR